MVAAVAGIALLSAVIALPIWALAVHVPRVFGLLVLLVPLVALALRVLRGRRRAGVGGGVATAIAIGALAAIGLGVAAGVPAATLAGVAVLSGVAAWRRGGAQ